MEQTENGVHGLTTTVYRLKHSARAAIFCRRAKNTTLLAVLQKAGVQPAGMVNMLIMSRTVSIVAGHDLPTVDILTALSQLDNRRLQLVQHIPAFLEKFVYNFSLFRRNIVAHSSLSECFVLLF
jgi:hypothetical protein